MMTGQTMGEAQILGRKTRLGFLSGFGQAYITNVTAQHSQ
jgi:hypothetical protein